MTFISYAQNFEDVMLWRALRNVEKGFYIDVGANDPSIESVTKAFYERGWSGINIEPLSVHIVDLRRERPRDINLRCAAGPSIGEIHIWESEVRGWASVDKETIKKHTAAGDVGKIVHQVPMLTLAKICEQNAPQEIHFLKIDVEGFERSVLEGMDFQRFRPWIVVVEATQPGSTEEVHHQWEDLLLTKNYFFVYADGLNRFYLAREWAELLPAFRYPPNIFDDFVSIRTMQTEVRANTAEVRANTAEATIKAMQSSRSWRLTKPLRWAAEWLREMRAKLKKSRISLKRLVYGILFRGLTFINRQPKLRRYVLAIINKLGLYGIARTLYARVVYGTDIRGTHNFIPTDLPHLTPRARQIYANLKAAIKARNKEDN